MADPTSNGTADGTADKATVDGATIDLDAIRARRLERMGKTTPPVVHFGGEAFTLTTATAPLLVMEPWHAFCAADKLPGETVDQQTERGDKRIAALEEICTIALGEQQWTRIKQLGADYSDMASLVMAMFDAWHAAPGESPASPAPSSPTSKRSRPTSSSTTRSTSRRASGARRPSGSTA